MRKKEYRNGKSHSARFYPFDELSTEIVADGYPRFGDSEITYTVNWPSIGSVNSTDAREFAAAIVAACDWLDEQKGGE